MKKICRAVAAVLLCAVCLSICSCSSGTKKKYTTTYFDYFDTFATITVYANSQKDFEVWDNILKSELEKYHQLLDIYNEYEGVVNLCTLNKDAGQGAVRVGDELFDFLIFAKEAYTLTGGYTSVALGSVTSLWKQAIADKTPPTPEALEEAAKHTDISSVLLDDIVRSVYITDKDMRLDAGALGKGYVAEVICERLVNAGCENFLLDLGGNLSAFGEKPDGTVWYGGIQDPDGDGELSLSLNISGLTLSTSGSYNRNFSFHGLIYHHIINPQTLYPENTYSSVSVLCPSGANADALSTALFSMSFEDGMALANTLERTEVIWIFADGSIKSTDGIELDQNKN